MKTVYLDYAATTPIDPAVLKKMLPYLQDEFGNASSIHSKGQTALIAVDKARKQIAAFLNCEPEQIIFCGSATEANNLAIQGLMHRHNNSGHIITSKIEHPAVMNTIAKLATQGVQATYLSPTPDGIVKCEGILDAIKENTVLISIMYANNEIGTIQPIKEIGILIAKENLKRPADKKIYFHTDAVQAINYLDCNVKELGVDFLALSGHKIYGPKGIGVLFVKDTKTIEPIIYGGGQEFGLRSGTENVASIVGFGAAVELIDKHKKNIKKIQALRDKIIKEGLKISGVRLNGSSKERLSNNVNLSFGGIEGESLLISLDQQGIAVSTGSACSSKELKPSHVLLALGLSPKEAHGSLRISLGRFTTQKEIDYFLKVLPGVVKQLKMQSPFSN